MNIVTIQNVATPPYKVLYEMIIDLLRVRTKSMNEKIFRTKEGTCWYVNQAREDRKHGVRDFAFLETFLQKGLTRFGKGWKLSSRGIKSRRS